MPNIIYIAEWSLGASTAATKHDTIGPIIILVYISMRICSIPFTYWPDDQTSLQSTSHTIPMLLSFSNDGIGQTTIWLHNSSSIVWSKSKICRAIPLLTEHRRVEAICTPYNTTHGYNQWMRLASSLRSVFTYLFHLKVAVVRPPFL